MNRKVRYIIFCSVVVALFSSILFIVPDNKFLFKNAIGDCSGRTEFMYNALYVQKSEADVVLFGSSRTMNGINDSTFGKNKLLNLGYCRFGRNLDEFFIEEYLKTHQPKKLFLEIREEEGDNSHPLTPFLLPVSKIAEGFSALDADVFSNLYNKWLCNLKYTRNKIFQQNDTSGFSGDAAKGFWENKDVTEPAKLNGKRSEDSLELYDAKNPETLNRNSEFYFKKIKEQCDEKKVKLFFLYIPSYGNVYKRPTLEKNYSQFSTCVIPPDSIFCNSSNFADYNHLNKKGSNLFTVWFNNYLETVQ